jgi:small subunit ribosomal protein S6
LRKYETVFIVNPELTTEDAEKTLEFFKENITKNGGNVTKVDPWGRQKLAYEIENHKEGYYFLIQFEASPEYPSELLKRFKFDENVLRYVIVQLDGKKFKEVVSKGSRRQRKPGQKKVEAQQAETPKQEAAAETVEPSETSEKTSGE